MAAITSKPDVEILGEYTRRRGEFDPTYTDRVIRRDGKTYLIHWMFSGIDSLRGGAVRPYLFDVRPDQLACVMGYFLPDADTLHAHYEYDVIAILDGCREINSTHWAYDYSK